MDKEEYIKKFFSLLKKVDSKDITATINNYLYTYKLIKTALSYAKNNNLTEYIPLIESHKKEIEEELNNYINNQNISPLIVSNEIFYKMQGYRSKELEKIALLKQHDTYLQKNLKTLRKKYQHYTINKQDKSRFTQLLDKTILTKEESEELIKYRELYFSHPEYFKDFQNKYLGIYALLLITPIIEKKDSSLDKHTFYITKSKLISLITSFFIKLFYTKDTKKSLSQEFTLNDTTIIKEMIRKNLNYIDLKRIKKILSTNNIIYLNIFEKVLNEYQDLIEMLKDFNKSGFLIEYLEEDNIYHLKEIKRIIEGATDPFLITLSIEIDKIIKRKEENNHFKRK